MWRKREQWSEDEGTDFPWKVGAKSITKRPNCDGSNKATPMALATGGCIEEGLNGCTGRGTSES